MTGESDEDVSMRAYLLGELPQDEELRIEGRLLLDRDLIELLQIIEEELIDSYVRNTLSDRERKEFESHFLSTPQRRRQLGMAKALRKYVNSQEPAPQVRARSDPRPSWFRQLFSSAWRPAVFAMLVLGISLGVWRGVIYRSLADRGRTELQAALRESPIEGRIAGFKWAPRDITYGGTPDNVADRLSLDRAASYLQEAVGSQGNSDSRYALGQLYLARREFDRAIEQFTQALEGSPKKADLHSDMGAALLEKGKDSQPGGPGGNLDLFRALEHLDTALELNDSLLPALFNRALCREYLALPAQDDWRLYLGRDDKSPWADVARRHLKEAEEKQQKNSQSADEQFGEFLSAFRANDQRMAWQLASQNRDLTRGQLFWWQLLDEFFKSADGGMRTGSGESLQALRYLGNLKLHPPEEHGDYRGDPYLSELARFYETLSPSARAALADAHNLVNEGNRLCLLVGRYDDAIGAYSRAGEVYVGLGDQWEKALTDLLIGTCYVQKGEMDKGSSAFGTVAALGREKGYLWLEAESSYGLGRAHDMPGEHEKAIEFTGDALKLSERIGDGYNAQRSLTQIADQYRKLANYDLAIDNLNSCLETIIKSGWPGARQMIRNCNQLMQVLSLKGLNTAATAYGNEALRLAMGLGDQRVAYLLYVHLGLIQGRRQNFTEAIRLAQSGLEAANAVPDEKERLGLLAYTSFQLGNLHRQAGDYGQALARYDQAIEQSNAGGAPHVAYGAHKGKLFCHIAQKNDAATEAELSVTLDLLEKNRRKILDQQNSNIFFDSEQSVYDAAIDFHHTRRGDDQAVFNDSEKSHARWLLDLISTARPGPAEPNCARQDPIQPISHPLDLAEVQRRLPDDETQLIEYSVLDDKVLICLVSRSEFSVKAARIGLGELANKVSSFRDSISRKRPEVLSDAQDLYNLLIKPIGLQVEKGKKICIVPDKVLNRLPFAALASPGSDRYLVQDYQLTFAPSAAVYLACSAQSGHTADRPHERLLAVGDPSFDRTAFSSYPKLPMTQQQVEGVKQYYPQSRLVLTGVNATEDAVKRGMEESDVIHLASHYVVHESDPMNSGLLLAPEQNVAHGSRGSSGFLRADEVYRLKLCRCPLVVLSACDSGVERYYNGEGMIGLARAFIAAGAPVVVASLWQVEAYATNDLMVNFHRYREVRGLSTSAALMEAQKEMLGDNSRKHPYYWAAFTAVGGQTVF